MYNNHPLIITGPSPGGRGTKESRVENLQIWCRLRRAPKSVLQIYWDVSGTYVCKLHAWLSIDKCSWQKTNSSDCVHDLGCLNQTLCHLKDDELPSDCDSDLDCLSNQTCWAGVCLLRFLKCLDGQDSRPGCACFELNTAYEGFVVGTKLARNMYYCQRYGITAEKMSKNIRYQCLDFAGDNLDASFGLGIHWVSSVISNPKVMPVFCIETWLMSCLEQGDVTCLLPFFETIWVWELME